MAAFFQSPVSLTTKDFVLFHRQFSEVIESFLPVSGSVSFFEQNGTWLTKERAKKLLGKGFVKLPGMCKSLEAGVVNGVMVFPAAVADGDNVTVLVNDIDRELLSKMAPEWLQDLREKIQDALVRTKQAYIFPETGLYTSRLLELVWTNSERHHGAFYLIGASEKIKNPTGRLIRINQIARLLEATVTSPVLYLGGDVFGVYLENISRENALPIARRILGSLKREGLHAVHVGIVIITENEEKSTERILDEGWEALETAEERGPFSLCEFSSLEMHQYHPLSLPERETVRKLQSSWRGMPQFSLLLFRQEKSDRDHQKNTGPDATHIKDILRSGDISVLISSDECFVLLPGIEPKKALQEAKKIKQRLDTSPHPHQVAVGVSYWPCGNFTKTATAANCRKALMHGDFFGPGSVTLFDHVSLNVSGDHFFDEGNYRQAVHDYRAGLMLKRDEVNLMNSLGVALTELNRLKEAVHCFEQVLDQEPRNFMALVNRGFALRMLGREAEALSCLGAAEKCKEFSSSPVAADVSLQLSRLYGSRGEYKKAIRVLERMRSRNAEKTGYLLWSLLGEAYAANGNNDKAIGMLQKAIRYNPQDARSLSILGELYAIEGEGNEIALSLCKSAVNIDDRSWENWYRLARVRYKVADYEEALTATGKSLHKNGKAVDTLFLAGKIYVKLGDRRQARKMFQKVIRIAPGFKGAIEQLRKI